MDNEKSIYEKLFIFICFVITIILIYYFSKEPQVESGNIYISRTVQNNGQTNGIKTGEKSGGNTDLIVTKSKTSVIELRTGSIEPTNSKSIQSLQVMSKNVRVYVKGFNTGDFANDVATYAYWISDGDINFLATLKAENGTFDPFKQSYVKDKNGPNGREDSRGFCQLNRRWHRDIVDTREFREDWKRQLEQCYKKYKGGTKFYGYYVRHKWLDSFIIKNM